jgi:hypothetical protein
MIGRKKWKIFLQGVGQPKSTVANAPVEKRVGLGAGGWAGDRRPALGGRLLAAAGVPVAGHKRFQ